MEDCMEDLTLTYKLKTYRVKDAIADDVDAYQHDVRHFVTTTNGEDIILTGYRGNKLLYAVKTSIKTYKREADKIVNFINNEIDSNDLYITNPNELERDCLLYERRVILYESNDLSLLLEHDLQLTKTRMLFVEQNFNWGKIEELVNQYEINLDKKNKRYTEMYRNQLEMLRKFDFLLLSKNTYIFGIYEKYLNCLKRDEEAIYV
jgi:hypothetical protein